MKLSDYIVSYLEERGVKVIFGYIGGMITHLVDSIALNPNMQFVQTYHEQTAAIAAEGFAKESGLFGVAISTSGPGATNMMTGIADAYFDSIPVLYITGQVNTYEYKYDKPIRQQGFQETDIVSMVRPITKYAKLVDKAEDIKYELDKALHIALSGRKGPVLLDLPMNIQRAEIEPTVLKGYLQAENDKIWAIDWEHIKRLAHNSSRPMLLVGAGCHFSNLSLLQEFIERTQIPVVTSLMGKGIINETYEYYLGMIGSYGNRCANIGIANSDLVIALGTRLDTRQTGAMLEGFLPKGKIIHVDIDENELESHRLPNRFKINSSIEFFLEQEKYNNIFFSKDSNWNKYLSELKSKYNQDKEIERFIDNKAPYKLMQYLNQFTKEGDVICTDIGQNQMWAAQALKLKKDQHFVTSGGLAPMGFSLPVAIGTSFASPKRTIYSINGDGGFHMAMQSLMLISQYNLPVKIIVLNNTALGMITQFQHLYFKDRMTATTRSGGYLTPNISEIASAYNLPYFYMNMETVDDEKLWDDIRKVRNCIVEYYIEGLTSVFPKLEFDKPIFNLTPLLPEQELSEAFWKVDIGRT